MKKETILYGTAVLILTNSIVKVLSLVYRGILIRLIGPEGLGLTELMMPLYSFLLVVASFGIPLAMSNLISAENSEGKIKIILRTGTILLLRNSLLVTAAILLIFPFIKDYVFADQRIIPGFFALIPSIFIISIFSALRGYFQGSHQASVLGKSQVAEQLARLLVGTGITVYMLAAGWGLWQILVGISLATLFAEGCGGCYLWYRYKKQKIKAAGAFSSSQAKKMLRLGAPVTMSRLVISLTAAIQAMMIPCILMANGVSSAGAATFYGLFAGVALTILHLPAIITGALTTPLIPAIAAANAANQISLRNRRIVESIRFTFFTALPILALLYYFAEDLCKLLFAAPQAGSMLSLLCLGAIFLYIQQPVIAILQGMNRFYRIFIHYCIADALYIGALFLLWKSIYFSIPILILLFILNDILVFFLNYYYMKRLTGFKVAWLQTYFFPFLGIIAGFLLMLPTEKWIMQTNIPEILSMMLSACVFLITYLFTLCISGALNKETLKALLFPQKRR